MSKHARPEGDVVVTTSDFVRQFGHWQERASRAPVYILHRGRPRFVMTSVETMQQLCAIRGDVPDMVATADDAALLDLVSEIILILDADLRVVQSSAAARRYFGVTPAGGIPVAQLVERDSQAMLDQALRRVLSSGLGETIEVGGPYPARQLAFTMFPHPRGVAAVARDVTIVDELDAARAEYHAESAAIDAIGDVATARLNLRGYIDALPVGLAHMAGLGDQALVGVRFTGLIARHTRVAVDDAIEIVLAQGKTAAVDAALLVGGQHERPVRIGMAPVRRGSPVTGVALAIVDRCDWRAPVPAH